MEAIFLSSAAILFLYVTGCFLLSVIKKRADLADIAWGPGFILVAWVSLLFGQTSINGLIVNALITAWGLRLFIHIYFRNKGPAEDFRYKELKKGWKKHFYLNLYFKVFFLQGLILYIVALPILWIHAQPEAVSPQLLGIVLPIWLIGFGLETLADWQLTLFKKDPSNKGQLLTRGVWSYVRHPNYLGEIVQWWAIWFMTIFLPFGWALIVSPLLITFLIVSVSGVRPLEEKMKNNPEFKLYAEKTSSLMPPSLVSAIFYTITWFVLIIYGSKGQIVIPVVATFFFFALQVFLIQKYQKKILRISILLSVIGTLLGLFQEMIFIRCGILSYPGHLIFPPLWLLAIYLLFFLTLNFSLSFLNKNLVLAFFLGGFGALLSYLSGQRLGGVTLFQPLAYPVIFFAWGSFLALLIFINRNKRLQSL